METEKTIAIAGGAALVLIALFYALCGMLPFSVVVSDMLAVVCAGAAALLFIYAWMVCRKCSKCAKNARLLIGIGILLWFLGEATWAYFDFNASEIPYPSLADAFYAAGYLPIIMGAQMIFAELIKGKKGMEALAIGSTLLGSAAILALLLPSALADEDPLVAALTLAYPLLDVIMFSLSIAIIAMLWGARKNGSWLAVAFGFVVITFADVLFALSIFGDAYGACDPLNALWPMGYALLAIGALLHHCGGGFLARRE